MEEQSVMVRQENLPAPMSANEVIQQVKTIQEIMTATMKEGEHFGVIPGCSKPTLYKAGAEKLALTFRLAPKFEVTTKDFPHGHREYTVICSIYHIITGAFLGQGVGTASTLESKYRYRKAEQKCPVCGKETIIKGKKEYGGGWLCYTKKGGCGAKFQDGDPAIENQNMGRVEYEDPADYYNTALKIAKKRALTDATLTVTAASDIFVQDAEDLPETQEVKQETPQPTQSQSKPPQGVSQPATPAQVKKIQATFGSDYNIQSEDIRHEIGKAVLQRQSLKSFNDLSKQDASTLIDKMLNDKATVDLIIDSIGVRESVDDPFPREDTTRGYGKDGDELPF